MIMKHGLAPPFPPMRVLEVYWSWALGLVCEVVSLVHYFPSEHCVTEFNFIEFVHWIA